MPEHKTSADLGGPAARVRDAAVGLWVMGSERCDDVNGFVNETVRNGADSFDTV